MKQILLLVVFAWPLFAQAQRLPRTEVFAFDYMEGKKRWKIGNAKLLTHDNRMGYNNQPAFIGHEIYITQSSGLDGKQQTDIVSFNLEERLKTIVTKTRTSEYSPSMCPDGKHFSVVQADENGKQHLVKYPLDRKSKGKKLFANMSHVGYHCWLSDTRVALFLVEEDKGNHLVIGNVETGKTEHVAFNIGRCIKRSPQGSLVFLDQSQPGERFLKTYKPGTGQSVVLGEMLGEGEDFEVLPNGYVIIGYEGAIHRLEPERGRIWRQMGSITPFIRGKKITRIAATNNRLAVVVE